MEIFLLFSILLAAIALGIPIGICLGLATALTLFFTSNIPLVMISQNAFAALDSFPLMAISSNVSKQSATKAGVKTANFFLPSLAKRSNSKSVYGLSQGSFNILD